MLPLPLPLPLPLCLSSPSQDINPSSMFIDHAGNVNLCDFGIHDFQIVRSRDGGTSKYIAVSLCSANNTISISNMKHKKEGRHECKLFN